VGGHCARSFGWSIHLCPLGRPDMSGSGGENIPQGHRARGTRPCGDAFKG
jgi:hypothetical protein